MKSDDYKDSRRYRKKSPKENKIYKTLVYSTKHKKYLSTESVIDESTFKETEVSKGKIVDTSISNNYKSRILLKKGK